MLRIIGVNPLVADLIVDENSIVNRVNNNEVDGAKINLKMDKSKSQDNNKSKNLVKFFLLSLKFLSQNRISLLLELGKPLPS